MLSLEKKFLFIHVPKTGGNSIQNILKDFSEDKIVCLDEDQDGIERFGVINDKYNTKKHATLDQYRKVIDSTVYQALFKFSIIRNPWDRCVSFYFSPSRGKIEWDRENFRAFIHKIPTINYFITHNSWLDKIKRKLGRRPIQTSKPIDNDIDFLIRFENLDKDFKKVCEKINIPYVKLPHRNKSTRSHYSKYYDTELVELVRAKFKDEIKYGDYYYEELIQIK